LVANSGPVASEVKALVSGSTDESRRVVCAEEQPVAFRYNGFPHGVMMATPDDLLDFAYGFSLTEGIIDRASDIEGVASAQGDAGIAIDISLGAASLHRYLAARRIRQLRGNTSCGLCGVEDLADVRRPPLRTPSIFSPEREAMARALHELRDWQPLSRATHGAHAAAWASAEGAIQLVREDVGRHNALDKLIGAGLRGGFDTSSGFCAITSRCSFEMVQKALVAGFSALVAASAPTGMAIRTARTSGLFLATLSRDHPPLIFAQRGCFAGQRPSG